MGAVAAKRIALILAGVAVIALAAMVVAGEISIRPDKRAIGAPPEDWPAETVSFQDIDGRILRGWYRAGTGGIGTVVLAHGIRGDRKQMLGRARFLSDAGYGVLLFDMQAHGESDGDIITFGFLEARGVTAAVAYARDRVPGLPVAVVGVSLGGAASLMDKAPLAVDALVLEGVYTTLGKALDNRLTIRYGALGPLLAPTLTWQAPWRLGYDPDALSPLARIAQVRAPLLMIAGGADRRTTIEDTHALYLNAPWPRALWVIETARHQNFHARAPKAYERRVLAFLARCFRRAR